MKPNTLATEALARKGARGVQTPPGHEATATVVAE